MTQPKIRDELERKFPKLKGLKEREWQWLEDENYINEHETEGTQSPKSMYEAVLRHRAVFGNRRKRASADPGSPEQFLSAKRVGYYESVSEVVALAAREDPVVDKVRDILLPKTPRGEYLLVPWEDVPAWIDERVDTPTLYVEAPEGDLASFRGTRISSRGVSARVLEYITSSPSAVRSVRTTLGGPLEVLRIGGEQTATKFGWRLGQATTFILTGVTPLLEPIRASFSEKPIRAVSRIKFEVDPTITPKELSSIYAQLRKRITKGNGQGRIRTITDKHCRLAVFTASSDEESSWRERMNAWNKRHPKDSYHDYRNFRRDAVHAAQRLLDPW